MKKITVLVSGTGTNLKALIEALKNKEIKNGNISLVISSNKDAKAIDIAKQENIKTAIVDKKSFNSQKDFQDELYIKIKNEEPDLIVLAGFMHIIPKDIIYEYNQKIINIHPSLIPSFCGKGFYGLKVHEEALKKGVKLTGATVHFVNESVDGGPIILQKSVKVKQSDTPKKLQKRVMKKAEWKILKKAVNLICNNKLYIKNNIVLIKE